MKSPRTASATRARRGVPLIDGVEKVTGRARYTADLEHAGALVGRIFRSPVSHGEILRLDVSKASALAGVVAVVTGADCAHTYGVLPVAMNEYPLARDKVRYIGEPVAAVAAIDAATAARALDLIELEVRALPAYYTTKDARAADAVLLHDNKPGNVERAVHHVFGDVAAGFASADLVCEATIDCAEVNHAQMELHAALADFDPLTRRLTMQSVSQVGYYLHLMLARCLDMEESNIRIIKPFIGGGFGARVEVLNFEIVTALLARAAQGKVLIELTREECFLTHRGRPQTTTHLKLGMKKDGHMTACECEVVQAGGAYAGYGIITILYAGALLQGLYDIPAVKYDGYRAYTNLPPCGAMRGHGAINVRHAFEVLLNRMAHELELDPFALRRANLLKAPTRTLNELMINSYGLGECLDRVERASAWREAPREAAARQGSRRRLLPLRERGRQAHSLDWGTGCRRQHQARLGRRRHGTHGRRGHWSGIIDHGGDRCSRDAAPAARPCARDRRRQRYYAQGQRCVFFPHHFSGRQRGHRRRERTADHPD